jgi:hypothetical protein
MVAQKNFTKEEKKPIFGWVLGLASFVVIIALIAIFTLPKEGVVTPEEVYNPRTYYGPPPQIDGVLPTPTLETMPYPDAPDLDFPPANCEKAVAEFAKWVDATFISIDGISQWTRAQWDEMEKIRDHLCQHCYDQMKKAGFLCTGFPR